MPEEKSKKRREALRSLIDSHVISDQETLLKLIKKEYGIDTSQAVISRDLRALGVSKRSHGKVQRYEVFTSDASREILRLAVVDIVYNESLVVIKTLPGLAAFVADFIDLSNDPTILATLSGENVVFIVPTHVKNIDQTYESICSLTEFTSSKEVSL